MFSRSSLVNINTRSTRNSGNTFHAALCTSAANKEKILGTQQEMKRNLDRNVAQKKKNFVTFGQKMVTKNKRPRVKGLNGAKLQFHQLVTFQPGYRLRCLISSCEPYRALNYKYEENCVFVRSYELQRSVYLV